MAGIVRGVVVLALAVAALVAAASAQAAFPGLNGGIEFARCEGDCGITDLWSVRPGVGSGPHAAPLGVEDDPAISANGRQMVYRACDNQALKCGITIEGTAAPFPRPKLTDNSSGGNMDDYPAFSPDGGTVVFQRCPPSGPCSIWSIPASGGTPTQLTHPSAGEKDSAPAFSPDGRFIVFQHCPSAAGCEIDRIDPAGGSQTPLTTRSSGADDGAPNWSPDGASIVFQRCCDGSGHSQIAVMPAGGSPVTPVTTPDPGSKDSQPVFSPDGTQIAFVRTDTATGVGRISVTPATGGQVTAITTPTRGGDYKPDWGQSTPWFTASPAISGQSMNGRVLSAAPGSVLGGGTGEFSWSRCDGFGTGCTAIPGATGPTYKLTSADIGFPIKLRQDQTNIVGTSSAFSSPTPAVVPNNARCSNTFTALTQTKGTTGGDLISGTRGKDILKGGAGADCINGLGGNDKIEGGAGNDSLKGGAGRNTISGGPGKDVIDVANGSRDTVNCGSGKDRVKADRFDKLRGCERVRLVRRRRH